MFLKSFTFIFLLLLSFWANAQKINLEDQGPAVGEVFPQFEYVSLKGDSIKSEKLKDNVLIINIWFVGCRGCKQEEPYLKQITAQYQDNEKFKFVGFCMSSENRINRYLSRSKNYGYEHISLTRKEVEEKFSVITSPIHFIIKNGVLVAKHTGPIVSFSKSLDWFKIELENVK